MSHKYHPAQQDKKPSMTGKVENDTNKVGQEEPTQKNQGRRTPQSRSDREDQIGGGNQKMTRTGRRT